MTTAEPPRVLHELTVDDCMELLKGCYLGRLAFAGADSVQIVPLNFRFSGGAVVFRTTYGSMLDTIHGAHVAFEVDDFDETDHTGWSVVVRGLAEEVWRPEELQEIRDLPLRPWAPGTRDHYVRILPSDITGRRIAVGLDAGPPDGDSSARTP